VLQFVQAARLRITRLLSKPATGTTIRVLIIIIIIITREVTRRPIVEVEVEVVVLAIMVNTNGVTKNVCVVSCEKARADVFEKENFSVFRGILNQNAIFKSCRPKWSLH
jgi:hypothetical protein